MNNITDGLVSRLSSKLHARIGSLPACQVTSFDTISGNLARVVVSHSHDAGPEDNYKALAKHFGQDATPIQGSFRRINNKAEHRLVTVGFVQATARTEELTGEREKEMKVVAKNVLMDPKDESLWSIKSSPTGSRYISRQDNEDLSELLSGFREHKVGLTDISEVGPCYASVQTFVAFVDPDNGQIGKGLVVESNDEETTVLTAGSDNLVNVDNRLIFSTVANFDTEDEFLKRTLTAASEDKKVMAKLDDPDVLKAYFKQVYAYDPAYLALVEQAIDQSAAL